ncbi:MAG: virulence RhuM family protein [Bacteriovoracaceae bacterium]|nr:virulence RhuM family protein [Bacteriovoracaceae bacterium]
MEKRDKNNIVNDLQYGEILLYQTADGITRVEVKVKGESVWLSLNQMAELFQRDKSVISKHIKNVFEENELTESQTVAKFATVQLEGSHRVERQIEYFNLDVIISVGYRVKSTRGTQFRIWATQQLRDYIIKGFALDDKRLKEAGNANYFEELLGRIRDIRSSEKMFWKKVLEIYATSIDYNAKASTSQEFFSTVQNKMHWAAHGHTAAEVISKRSDANKPNMGLRSWTGDKPQKSDITIAKNYLNEDELNSLNRIVSFYLDFAEMQAIDRRPMYMKDWITKLDDFLRLSDKEILAHAGKISHEAAVAKAELEFKKFNTMEGSNTTPVEVHFDEAMKKVNSVAKKGSK